LASAFGTLLLDRNCPSPRLLDRIGDRWTVLTIGGLADGPHRFKTITQRIDGISQKMLTPPFGAWSATAWSSAPSPPWCRRAWTTS
jgi:hypothetical protein